MACWASSSAQVLTLLHTSSRHCLSPSFAGITLKHFKCLPSCLVTLVWFSPQSRAEFCHPHDLSSLHSAFGTLIFASTLTLRSGGDAAGQAAGHAGASAAALPDTCLQAVQRLGTRAVRAARAPDAPAAPATRAAPGRCLQVQYNTLARPCLVLQLYHPGVLPLKAALFPGTNHVSMSCLCHFAMTTTANICSQLS